MRTNFFGQSRNSDSETFSDWLVDNLIKGKRITVFDDVYFSPLNLQYLAKILEIVVLKRRIGTFNLGSREGMSKADFAFNLAEVLELSTKNMTRGGVDKAKLVAKRAKDMRMDSSRFEKEYGVELPTLKQEIQSMKSAYSY